MIRKSTALILCLFLLVGPVWLRRQSHGDPLKSPMKFLLQNLRCQLWRWQGATVMNCGNLMARVDYVWVLTE